MRCTVCLPEHLAWMQHRVSQETVVQIPAQSLTQARTLWGNDEPVCAFGITSPWPGLGVVWFLERDVALSQQYARAIARHVWCWLRCWEPDYRRLEALPLADRADSCRLIEWLGFQRSVEKSGYGPNGETMIEYVKFPQERKDGQ